MFPCGKSAAKLLGQPARLLVEQAILCTALVIPYQVCYADLRRRKAAYIRRGRKLVAVNKQKCLRFLVAAGTVILLVILLASVLPVLTPFIAAALLSYAFAPQITRMSKLGVPLWLSLTVLLIYLLSILYFLIALTLPVLSQQLQNLFDYLPYILDFWSSSADSLLSSITNEQLADKFASLISGFNQNIDNYLKNASADVVAFLLDIPGILLYVILTPILSYYFLRDREKIRKYLLSLIAPSAKDEFLRLSGELNWLVRGFISGYLLVAVIVALLTTLMYYLLGLQYPLVLGLIMGISDLIPYFGPVLGAIPAVLLALTIDKTTAFLVIIGLFIIQQVESSVITPQVMGNRVGLHPLLTIFVVLAGGSLGGLAGAILAVPLAAVILLIFKYLFSRVFSNNQLRNTG